MSMSLPVERMAKIIKAFAHEFSPTIRSYNGFVLKYVGDAVITFFLGNNVYKLLHPILQLEFQEMNLKKRTNEWKYIYLENNLLPYKIYTFNKRFVFNYL